MSEGMLTADEQRERLVDAERKGRRTVAKKAKQLEHLEVVYVSVDEIRPNSYNPNRQSEHDFELLLRSMEEDGFTQPALALKVTEEHQADPVFGGYEIGETVIIDGEHRWRAARKLGYDTIPIVYTDMTPEQMRISTLRHNRAHGSEDIELTAVLLRDLEKLGAKEWALDSLMMSGMELERLIQDVPAPEAMAGEEYDQAWEPDKAGHDIAPVEGRESTHDSGQWTNASTAEAIERSREREQALKEAKSEEQREFIKRDMASGFHRVSLLLYGEDADNARQVLKGAPAEVMAAMLRERLEKEPLLEDGSWVTLDEVIGRRTIPAESAKVIMQALEEAEKRGDVGPANRFQAIEYWAASYLAEPDAA